MSMENFFNWMSQPIPKEDVIIWFNVHNLNYEKIELYGDFFKSLNQVISDTYFGDEGQYTRIVMSKEDNLSHFDWCWEKIIIDFNNELILFNKEGQHKDYFKSFFIDTFYNSSEKNLKIAIPEFLNDVFNLDKPFTKSDLEILTEVYQLLEKNIQ
jgi:hypothetical protein